MMHTKKFTVLYELFIPSDDTFFSQPKPIGFDVWGSDRYRDEASRTRGILAELYMVFPDHLHTFISGHSQFNANVRCKLIMMSHLLIVEILSFV